VVPEQDRAAILAGAGNASAILVRTARIDAEVIAAAPGLRVVSRHGVGYDNVDVLALNARRIPLAIAANANRVAVAEHAMAMLLALAKAAVPHDAAVRAGNWAIRNDVLAFEIMEKRLLLLGFGRIGREVAIRARAFGMVVEVLDPFVEPDVLAGLGCEAAPISTRPGPCGCGEPAPAVERDHAACHRRPPLALMRPSATS
jgi:D-3-phosphoglycerate dehydrogenase